MDRTSMKNVVEAILFIFGEAVSLGELAQLFSTDKITVEEAIEELRKDYEESSRGMVIRRINSTYQMVSNPKYDEYIRRFCTPTKMKKLSQSALEVLAIVAYKQPVTKGEIDAIRGIKCDRVIEGLERKNLVCQKGRSKAIGKPILYGTTDEFLKRFGYETIKDLPKLEEVDSLFGGGGLDENQLTFDIKSEEKSS